MVPGSSAPTTSLIPDKELVLNSGSAVPCLKINIEESDGEKGKAALFRKPATWKDGGLTSQRHLLSPGEAGGFSRGSHGKREGVCVQENQEHR